MRDVRTMLSDQHVLIKTGNQFVVREFVSAIKSLSRRRQNLDDKQRIGQGSKATNLFKSWRLANNRQVRIAIWWKGNCLNAQVRRIDSAITVSQGIIKQSHKVAFEKRMLRAHATHAKHFAVEVLILFLGVALELEVFFERVP